MHSHTKGYTITEAVRILRNTPQVLNQILNDIDESWTNSRESENSWSPKEIVAHLIHGELTDWIPRTKIILSEEADKALVPFEMEGHLSYLDSPLDDLLQKFQSLRELNLDELESLTISESMLSKTALHPSLGVVTLRNHLSAWVVHDLGHIAQISRVMAKQYITEVGPWTDFMAILHDRKEPSNNS